MSDFTDSFNRTSGYLGNNWCEFVPPWTVLIANTTYFGRFRIGAMFDATQGLVVSAHGAVGVQNAAAPAFMVPKELSALGLRDSGTGLGVAQFSRITNYRRSAPTAATLVSGPAVFLNTGAGTGVSQCYYVHIISQTGAINGVFGWYGAVSAVIGTYYSVISAGFPIAINDNDIIELRVTPSAGSNDLEILINSVSQGTATDSNASRPTFGMPGVFSVPFSSNIGAVDQEYKNYVGGAKYW